MQSFEIIVEIDSDLNGREYTACVATALNMVDPLPLCSVKYPIKIWNKNFLSMKFKWDGSKVIDHEKKIADLKDRIRMEARQCPVPLDIRIEPSFLTRLDLFLSGKMK